MQIGKYRNTVCNRSEKVDSTIGDDQNAYNISRGTIIQIKTSSIILYSNLEISPGRGEVTKSTK